MVHILELFGNYITHHTCFDIVFSQKVGYIWFCIRDDDIEGSTIIESGEELLSLLFNELVYDAMFSGPYEHMEGYPSKEEKKEAKHRLISALQCGEEEKKKYLRLFDRHLKKMQTDILE